jgi:RNA polymerase sigma factor (TIGR02999 family)
MMPFFSCPIVCQRLLSLNMSDVTQILNAIEEGDTHASEKLLPLVYAELRKLAARKLGQEAVGHTLEATALVHEAYLRLVDVDQVKQWNSRGHFFAAAAEAIRRILIERARRKHRPKHGGGHKRVDLDVALSISGSPAQELLALDEVLDRLAATDALAANVVKLRYFAGLTMPQTAEALAISLRQAERNWTFAKTWLHRELAQVALGDADAG